MFGWREILDFWFGDLDEHGLPDAFHRNRWFRSSRSFDREIRRRFLSLVLVASEGGLESWRREPGGSLAEIILLDQFTRNIHRGGALAFDNDQQARAVARQGMERGQDLELPAIMQAFFYMPFQHSERLADQELAVTCYEQLVARNSGILRDFLESFLESARDHHDIIARFGRFPHRNPALGRKDRPDEAQYMTASGRTFGQ
ncbi:MAG: DUF924 family protein [Marinobacter sp.]|uniref:DUF924 family protein n=1 Tax=Marinobacter sp. TaxID=50741 RepID=UPI00299D91BD|nr:DUF924 family protein [Marinobacter sp.]MDX1635910.1 DUF924 family protein [Marinobacter sp.]